MIYHLCLRWTFNWLQHNNQVTLSFAIVSTSTHQAKRRAQLECSLFGMNFPQDTRTLAESRSQPHCFPFRFLLHPLPLLLLPVPILLLLLPLLLFRLLFTLPLLPRFVPLHLFVHSLFLQLIHLLLLLLQHYLLHHLDPKLRNPSTSCLTILYGINQLKAYLLEFALLFGLNSSQEKRRCLLKFQCIRNQPTLANLHCYLML